MWTSRLDRLAALVVVLTLGVLLAGGTGTDAAFVVPTSNLGNTFSAIPDWKPPVVARAAVVKAEGGIPGYVRAGGGYSVIASAADDPSSNPPAGIGTVQANVSTLTAGATALALPVAASTVAGQTYTHGSAASTVAAGRAAGTYAGDLTAADQATPANASTAFPFSAVVDNTVPAAASLVIANGGTAGRPDAGDTMTLTWDDVIDPHSVLPGWDGTTMDVTVLVGHNQGATRDWVEVRNAADTAGLPLGRVDLHNRDVVAANTTFGGPGAVLRSRLTRSSSPGTQLVLVLGTPDVAANVIATGAGGDFVWTPDATVFDRAGNPSATTAYPEPGATDRDF